MTTPLVAIVFLAVFFGFGVRSLVSPLSFYRMSRSVYKDEFLNSFRARVTSRVIGTFFMLFATAIILPWVTHAPRLSKG